MFSLLSAAGFFIAYGPPVLIGLPVNPCDRTDAPSVGRPRMQAYPASTQEEGRGLARGVGVLANSAASCRRAEERLVRVSGGFLRDYPHGPRQGGQPLGQGGAGDDGRR